MFCWTGQQEIDQKCRNWLQCRYLPLALFWAHSPLRQSSHQRSWEKSASVKRRKGRASSWLDSALPNDSCTGGKPSPHDCYIPSQSITWKQPTFNWTVPVFCRHLLLFVVMWMWDLLIQAFMLKSMGLFTKESLNTVCYPWYSFIAQSNGRVHPICFYSQSASVVTLMPWSQPFLFTG